MLRNMYKTTFPNDGTRTIFESALSQEVAATLMEWSVTMPPSGILVGDVALSFYFKPRFTEDCVFLYLPAANMPLNKVPGVEVITPELVGMSSELAQKIYDTSVLTDNLRIASRAGLIATKLLRFSLQGRADIDALLHTIRGPRHAILDNFQLTDHMRNNFAKSLFDHGA